MSVLWPDSLEDVASLVTILYIKVAASIRDEWRNMQPEFGASVRWPPAFDASIQQSPVCRSLPLINLLNSFQRLMVLSSRALLLEWNYLLTLM